MILADGGLGEMILFSSMARDYARPQLAIDFYGRCSHFLGFFQYGREARSAGFTLLNYAALRRGLAPDASYANRMRKAVSIYHIEIQHCRFQVDDYFYFLQYHWLILWRYSTTSQCSSSHATMQ